MEQRPSYEELEAMAARLAEELRVCRAGDRQARDAHLRLLAILDSLDAIVYVADMRSYELLFLNTYAKNLFGDITGKICWQSLQAGQTGPCPFCTNDKLLNAAGRPCGTHVWEFRNTRTGQWFYIHDKAIEWADGRLVRLEIATDISARKKAEQDLAESEQRFRAIFDQTYQFIGLLSPEGILLEANQTALDFAGVRREEAVGRPFWETPWWRHSPEMRARLRQAVAEAAAGRFYRFQATHSAADGGIHHVDFSIKPVKNSAGEVILLIPEGRDITDAVKTQQALAESELKFRAIFDQAFQLAGILTPEGTVVMANRQALDFAGISEQEVVGRPFWETPWWTHSGEVQGQLRYALGLAAKGQTAKFISTHYDKAGELHYIDVSIKPLLDPAGRVAYLVPAGRDITARVKAEDALRASEEQYRSIFEAAQDGFFIMSLAGQVIEVNSALCRQHGYSREELLTMNPLEVVHPDFRKFFPIMLKELNRGNPFYLEGCHVRKDGSFFEVDIRISPFAYQGKPHIFGVVRDIGERKRAEAEKQLLESQLRQSQKMEAIGTLAGGIAHDFNNILTAILGYTDLAAHLLPKDSPVLEHLQAVGKAGVRARDLVKQILAFSRQAEQSRKPIEISPVVKEVLKLLRASLPTTIEIRQNICEGLGTILADPTQIHQILLNLCANAADAMEKNGGILTVELCNYEGKMPPETGAEGARAWVRLSVHDTGKGIPASIRERIFEPFYTTKEKGKGTGLGLSVVHGIVQSHDGKITVESTPGRGCSFHVFFPIVESRASVVAPDTSPPVSGRGRVLLVDDEEAVVVMEKEMLESLGYTVTATTSSVELLVLFRERSAEFDLVITDQTMPVLPGTVLVTELRKVRADLPIILCTGYSSVIDEAKAKSLGVREFLMKPFDIRQLAAAVHRALAGG
ncbi:PAS domain-containing hybrid sensor histidine kinase/response regulator [Thiovibrio sp. JS02]